LSKRSFPFCGQEVSEDGNVYNDWTEQNDAHWHGECGYIHPSDAICGSKGGYVGQYSEKRKERYVNDHKG
jgi:hypothetical protein